MRRSLLPQKLVWVAVILIAGWSLVACERPDPGEQTAIKPSHTSTPVPSPATPFTFPPLEIHLIVITPTPDGQQHAALDPIAGQPTFTPVAVTPQPTVTLHPAQDSGLARIAQHGRPNHYLGWAWREQLNFAEYSVAAGVSGLALYDRPSEDARRIGLVVGLADVIVAGKSYCGYTPILVYEDNLLSVVLPQPDIAEPEPLSASAAVGATPPSQLMAVELDTTEGWVVSNRLTMAGEVASSSEFSLNLRADPCRYAENLGLVPAGAPMSVIGAARGEYTPVRVDLDLMRRPVSSSTGEND